MSRGIAWNALHQLVEVALAFGAMLILVRIIPPVQYGLVGAVVGLLTLLNAFNFSVFAAQALQLPDGSEPDWSLHWSVGLYIQASLMLACHALAGVCWLVPTYRPLAPLLHLAAVGMILDWPAQLEAAMLRRELDFGRLKVLLGCSTALKLGVTLLTALVADGAYAIVLGSNVVTPLPLAIDLLLVRRWRPRPGWWRWPDWAAYRPSLHFGLQQSVSALLAGARGTLEAAVLPAGVGYTAIGLLNRARALLGTTIGRVGNVLVETAYPLLPRYAADPKRYAQQATLFAQVLLLIALPGTLYLGIEGRSLSRLLYGQRWIAADPLIWPAAVSTLGLAMFGTGSGVLLAASRLRLCLVLDVMAAALSLPMAAVAWSGYGIEGYAWAVGISQLVAGAVALAAASPLLGRGWIRSTLLPPALGGSLALAAVVIVGRFWVAETLGLGLCRDTCVYVVVLAVTLRGVFPLELVTVLGRVPGGQRVSAWLRLQNSSAVSVVP